MPLDQRARQIFAHFRRYNYDVKQSGDVIRFIGNYKASRGQAAALTFYVFMGMFISVKFEQTLPYFQQSAS